jgi:hypothetical protein
MGRRLGQGSALIRAYVILFSSWKIIAGVALVVLLESDC